MMQKQSIFLTLIIICTSAFIFLTILSCGGGGGEGGNTPLITPPPQTTTTISGYATKGPISGATVTAYSVTNGYPAAPLARATTSSNGSYSLEIPSTYTGPVVLIVNGGHYTDEATGNLMSSGQFRAAFMSFGLPRSVTITPLTEIAVLRAQQMGGLTTVNIMQAMAQVSLFLNTPDITSLTPAITTAPFPENATQMQKDYGFLLAALSQMAVGNSIANVVGNIAVDLSDNKLDTYGNQLLTSLTTFSAAPVNQSSVVVSEGFEQYIVTTYAIENTSPFTPCFGFTLSPLDGSTIAINAPISATINMQLDPTTVNSNTVVFRSSGSIANISGNITYLSNTITYTPINPLEYNTTYTFSLASGIKSLLGNSVDFCMQAYFTTDTGPDPFPPP